LNCALPLVLAFLSAASSRATEQPQSYGPVDPKAVKFTVKVAGRPPLPFQAVRLRVTLKNVSTKRIGPVGPVDNIKTILVRGPGEPKFREVKGARTIELKGHPSNPTDREALNNRAYPTLESGEQMSATFAVAAEWSLRRGGWAPADRVQPLFPAPGDYELKVVYCRKTEAHGPIERTVRVRVLDPAATQPEPGPGPGDELICRHLRNDPRLVAELLCPVGVMDKRSPPRLRALLKQYPKSSYAPYARFALARHSGGKAAVWVAELEGAARADFPYRPNALVALRRAGRAKAAEVDRTLARDYADSVERLEVVAKDYTPGQWRAFRTGRPIPPPERTDHGTGEVVKKKRP
jgi:hypothetical protein